MKRKIKKIYVLYSMKQIFYPKVYKTLQTVKFHMSNNPKLAYKQFLFPEDVNEFIIMLVRHNTLIRTKKITQEDRQKAVKYPPKNLDQNEGTPTPIQQQVSSNISLSQQKDPDILKQINKRWFQLKQIQNYSNVMKSFEPTQPLIKFTKIDHFVAFVDGASKGNPGNSGVGYFIINGKGERIITNFQNIGNKTNNQAEFTSLTYCIADAYCNGIKKLHVFCDSLLVQKAIKGKYVIREPRLQQILQIANFIIKKLNYFEITHISRNCNSEADKLANKGVKKSDLII